LNTGRQFLQARAQLLALVRQFFQQRDVVEVCTPVLSQAAGTDPGIEPFSTRYLGPGYPDGLELYLHSSPEFAMKRLLAAGSGAIYQIAQVFRNGEYGARHNPEFTLLEWYRPGFDHHDLMQEVASLVCHCLNESLPVEKISYSELFQNQFGWDPLQADTGQMKETAKQYDVDTGSLEHPDEYLDLLMSMVLEPTLGDGRLTFIHDYPASQASLARLNRNNPQLASRFELYCQGVELANGFHELTDAREQRSRFEQENHQRQQLGLLPMPLDENFLHALKKGLPDCSGVALGLDRLLMLKQGGEQLRDVLTFALSEA
jgi:lysyl-tRNA synthetase class 2